MYIVTSEVVMGNAKSWNDNTLTSYYVGITLDKIKNAYNHKTEQYSRVDMEVKRADDIEVMYKNRIYKDDSMDRSGIGIYKIFKGYSIDPYYINQMKSIAIEEDERVIMCLSETGKIYLVSKQIVQKINDNFVGRAEDDVSRIPVNIGKDSKLIRNGLGLPIPKIDGMNEEVRYRVNSKNEVLRTGLTVDCCGELIVDKEKVGEKVIIPICTRKISTADYYSFNSTRIKEVICNDELESIGERAFIQCRELESIKLNHGLKSIGMAAFSHCKSLRKVEIPDTVEYIHVNAFNKCSMLCEINIPRGLIVYNSMPTLNDILNLELRNNKKSKLEVSIPNEKICKDFMDDCELYEVDSIIRLADKKNKKIYDDIIIRIV